MSLMCSGMYFDGECLQAVGFAVPIWLVWRRLRFLMFGPILSLVGAFVCLLCEFVTFSCTVEHIDSMI